MKNKKNIIVIVLIFISMVIGFCVFTNIHKNNSRVEVRHSTSGINTENNVTLNANNITYRVRFSGDQTVYDIMNILASEKTKNFSFKAKEYPRLGYFVEEINSVKGGQGKYWIYTVNDEEASVGISQYILHSGDIINWELK